MIKAIRTLKTEPVDFYTAARHDVLQSKYFHELEWQDTLDIDDLTESKLLREAAWVVINSGFREKTARKYFSNISLSFGDWESADHIVTNRELCVNCALDSFNHKQKMNAIVGIAEEVSRNGFESFRCEIIADPILALSKLPYIGPVTVWHLAKNIGCDVAKPDRHIVRVANTFGFECVQEFCKFISINTGDKVSVVDIVLWRYFATLH